MTGSSGSLRPVVVVQAMNVADAERVARACQEVHGGRVLRLTEPLLPGPLWETVEETPPDASIPLGSLFREAAGRFASAARTLQELAAPSAAPELPPGLHRLQKKERDPRNAECDSCEAYGEIRRWLEVESEKLGKPMQAPLWVVPDPALEPWEWLGILGWETLETSAVYLASFISVLNADRFWSDWVSSESTDLTDPDAPSVAHQLCGLVEFADDWVLEGEAATDHGLAAFLSRLNPEATVHSPSADPRAIQTLGLRALARGPGEALDAPRAVWRAKLMGMAPESARESVTVFRSRRPFHPDRLHTLLSRWPEAVLRTEGTLWLASHPQLAFHVSQVGPSSFELASEGEWLALLPPKELSELRGSHPEIFDQWDSATGDRQNELVFVWEDDVDPEFEQELAGCILGDFEMRMDWSRLSAPSLGAPT